MKLSISDLRLLIFVNRYQINAKREQSTVFQKFDEVVRVETRCVWSWKGAMTKLGTRA